MDAAAPGKDFGRVLLASCLEHVDANTTPIASGIGTEEHVHQVRVGLRQVRTLLRDFPFLLPPFAPHVVAALKEAFDALGAHRDLYTLVPGFAARMFEDGAPPFAWRIDPAPPQPPEVVSGAGFRDTLGILARAAAERGGGMAPGLMRKRVGRELDRLHRRATRDAARFRELAPPERHALRKRMKRLRYGVELTLPLFGARAGKRFVDELKTPQAALGRYQDALTARALWTRQAVHAPQAWFGVGWLSAQAALLEEDCVRACCRFVEDAQPSWR